VPELPEVEVVRRGLDRWVSGRRIEEVTVAHPRAVRRHLAGGPDFADRLAGRLLGPARRRGKYLWLPMDDEAALLAHLGMSGQLLVTEPDAPDEVHLRVRVSFRDGGRELRFVDQRTFGGLAVAELVEADPAPAAGPPLEQDRVPLPVAHIARDPLDALLDEDRLVRALRRRRTGVKRALLDQTLVSGIGNIYADEALWRARLHHARATESLTPGAVRTLLRHVRDVMTDALAQGGTSFDALYVDVDGSSGWFERELAVYGRAGLPCRRCGRPIVREPFMNRSSFRCPRCQRRPRQAHW
jgi:formamidopyrimidine-DNA glycosylase